MSNIYAMSDTWTGGTLYTAIKMNVTDTSSDPASLLMDLQVGGVSKFSIGKGGAAVGTSLALGGATIGSDALGVTGTTTLQGTTISASPLTMSGNFGPVPAWTTAGLRYKGAAFTVTDNSSSGTVAAAYTNVYGVSTILASAAVTYTNYFNSYFKDPVASTNVTMTNAWSIGGDSLSIGTGRGFQVNILGATVAGGGVAAITTSDFSAYAGAEIGFNSAGSATFTSTNDAAFKRIGAANIRQGKASSETPIAQIFTIGEASRGGTDNNVSGANGTLQSGLGTGTGSVSKLVLQVPVLAASGTTQQTYGSAITINNSTNTGLQFNGYTSAGALSVDSSGNITSSSARAMKTAFRDFDYGLDTVLKISPQWWKWRKETDLDTEHEYGGFIADEVQALIPELEGHGDPTRLVLAACVNAIKELSSRL